MRLYSERSVMGLLVVPRLRARGWSEKSISRCINSFAFAALILIVLGVVLCLEGI